jgi:hypothetical protein
MSSQLHASAALHPKKEPLIPVMYEAEFASEMYNYQSI